MVIFVTVKRELFAPPRIRTKRPKPLHKTARAELDARFGERPARRLEVKPEIADKIMLALAWAAAGGLTFAKAAGWL